MPLFSEAAGAVQAPVTTIAHAIGLAVAPVFLLTGVAALLAVLTNRLGRAIDRSRVLQSRDPSQHDAQTQIEMHTLQRRAILINRSIGLCTACALLVCCVIMTLFLATFVALDLTRIVAMLFIGSMLCLTLALLYFMREILLATRNMRIAP